MYQIFFIHSSVDGHLGCVHVLISHFSILVWEIPWTEELGRLQSMGSQRVRHDLASEHTVMSWLL